MTIVVSERIRKFIRDGRDEDDMTRARSVRESVR